MMYLIENGIWGHFNTTHTDMNEVAEDIEKVARDYFRENNNEFYVQINVVDFEKEISKVFSVERVEYFNVSSN